MALDILTCEQNSPEWLQARLGIPTASRYATVLAGPQKGASFSKTRREYLYKLAGERLTGEPCENYTNGYMERGHDMEAEARKMYQFLTDADLEQVGFVHDPERRTGCSPDALIGQKGLLEIKTKAPHILIEAINQDRFCPEHVLQCQGALWITGREWVDLVCYYPKMPLFIKRAYRDEECISRIEREVETFNFELDATVRMIERYGEEKAA